MSDLKTLKEIQHHGFDYYDDGKPSEVEGHRFIQTCDLKEEAVKWIKYIPKIEGKLDKETQIGLGWTVGWIKHFFNITMEDLK